MHAVYSFIKSQVTDRTCLQSKYKLYEIRIHNASYSMLYMFFDLKGILLDTTLIRSKLKLIVQMNSIVSVVEKEKWSWSLSLRLVYPVLHKPPGATITSRSAVRIRINFWRMVGLYISFGDWANAHECWRSPSLRLVIPGIAVSPGVTHSDSRIVFVTGTVVKPQQPPLLYQFFSYFTFYYAKWFKTFYVENCSVSQNRFDTDLTHTAEG